MKKKYHLKLFQYQLISWKCCFAWRLFSVDELLTQYVYVYVQCKKQIGFTQSILICCYMRTVEKLRNVLQGERKHKRNILAVFFRNLSSYYCSFRHDKKTIDQEMRKLQLLSNAQIILTLLRCVLDIHRCL